MKRLLLIALIGIVAIQAAALLFLWGSPAQHTMRSYTPTPEPALPTPVPTAARTPIPLLVQATLPARPAQAPASDFVIGECRIYALDLLGAWAQAGAPEAEAFDFQDLQGQDCQGTYERDVMPLFTQPNLWYAGSLACTACHGENLDRAAARMDLTSYAGIRAGSRRENASAAGNDILGGGDWEKSKLHQVIITRFMPLGRPPTSPEKGPVIWVGTVR